MEHGQNSDEFKGWMIWGSNTNGARDFSCPHIVQTSSQSLSASYSMDIGILSWRQGGREVKLTSHLLVLLS